MVLQRPPSAKNKTCYRGKLTRHIQIRPECLTTAHHIPQRITSKISPVNPYNSIPTNSPFCPVRRHSKSTTFPIFSSPATEFIKTHPKIFVNICSSWTKRKVPVCFAPSKRNSNRGFFSTAVRSGQHLPCILLYAKILFSEHPAFRSQNFFMTHTHKFHSPFPGVGMPASKYQSRPRLSR